MSGPKDDLLTKIADTYEQLKKVRESTTVSIRSTPMLRGEFVGLDGELRPFRLRYYQVQAIYHLLAMKRFVLGDPTGSGKTAVVIASLCYTWEKEPQNKVIVVCPKSALRQWAAEIAKFAIGIQVYIVDGNPKQRELVYRQFAEHPVTKDAPKAVLMIGYAPLVRDWNPPGALAEVTASIPNLTVVADECFYYYTPVVLASGKTELIGKLVEGRRREEVLSWNWETGCVENKPIANWYKKPLVIGKRKDLLTIKFRFAGTVKATPSHVFYRVNGEKVLSSSLKPGAETAVLDLTAPSSDQEQLLFGSLLGDSSIDPHSLIWGICTGHSVKQEAYVNFKHGILAPLGASKLSRSKTEFQSDDQEMVTFRMRGNKYITTLLREWGVRWDNKKCITRDWLDRIGPLGLAFWYGDDGSLQSYCSVNGVWSYQISLHTEDYTRAENYLLAGWLMWKWGIKAEVKTVKRRRGRPGHYHYLYLPSDAAMRFLELLPGALPGVEYKFLPGTRVLRISDLDITPRAMLVKDEVLSVARWEPSDGHKARGMNQFVYDLEVADNHNYFANGSLVSNCTAFKSDRTKTWQVCSELSKRAQRVYGLSATLLKNNLIEGFAIYKCIYPQVFGTKTAFLRDYCVTQLQRVAGGRKIPIVVGYKNLEAFRARIDPFFLGRPKHVISNELPALTTREVLVELSAAEDAKYSEALTGVLSLGDGELRDYEENKALVALIYCQQTVDSLSLLRFDEGDIIDRSILEEPAQVKKVGSKEQALLDLLSEEFEGEKVIVYCRFASLIPRLQELCKREGILSVAVTGNVVDTNKDPARQRAQLAFQDMKSPVKVIFISDAGSEAINLQAASAMIFYDAPWSWGSYVQLLGRPIRIGSPHESVVAVHLVAERPRPTPSARKTIDHYTLAILQRKKALIDKVLGESAAGALDFKGESSFAVELTRSLKGGKTAV